jgi:REP element-mobilizing transposase RayT
VNALKDGDARFHRYQLHGYVVMPNHVHLLVIPSVPSNKWLGPLKGFTAHEANRILARTGPFWQNESYDHLVHNDEEFRRIQRYIEQNPVKAGLAASAEQFPWSSACGAGFQPAAGLSAGR